MKRRCMLMIAAAVLTLPAAIAAQGGGMQSWQDDTVADIAQMRDKFVSLAEAFPDETWDWRPMEGVRSVKDVMVLIVVEGHVFPGMWGADPPMGAASGVGDETARVAAMSKADIIREMERSLDYMVEATRCMTATDRTADASWFGTATNGSGSRRTRPFRCSGDQTAVNTRGRGRGRKRWPDWDADSERRDDR